MFDLEGNCIDGFFHASAVHVILGWVVGLCDVILRLELYLVLVVANVCI